MDNDDWRCARARTVAAKSSGVATEIGPLDDLPLRQQSKILRKFLPAVNLTGGAVLNVNRTVFLRMTFFGHVDGATKTIGTLTLDW
jgi:hypothetical protein